MPDEKNANDNVGLMARILRRRDAISSLKSDVPRSQRTNFEGLKNPLKRSSKFHLPPQARRHAAQSRLAYLPTLLHCTAKINRAPVRSATPGEWAASLFICSGPHLHRCPADVYYHPSKCRPPRRLYLEHACPFGKLLATCPRAAHSWSSCRLHMFRVFLTGSYKNRASSWNVGVIPWC